METRKDISWLTLQSQTRLHDIYSIMKNKSSFVILHDHIMRLPEETRDTFFNSISLDFPKNTRKQIYQYSDINGELHRFVYIKTDEMIPA